MKMTIVEGTVEELAKLLNSADTAEIISDINKTDSMVETQNRQKGNEEIVKNIYEKQLQMLLKAGEKALEEDKDHAYSLSRLTEDIIHLASYC